MPLTAYGVHLRTYSVEATELTFSGRAYGLDIRVEREADETLSVYGPEAYADDYTLLARGPVEEMVGRFDVSGGLRRWLERQAGVAAAAERGGVHLDLET